MPNDERDLCTSLSHRPTLARRDSARRPQNTTQRREGVSTMTFALASRRTTAVATAVMALLFVLPTAGFARSASGLVSVIVRALPGRSRAAEDVVRKAGGHIAREIGIIDGFTAELPGAAVPAVRADGRVFSVTPNARVHLLHAVDGFDASIDPASVYNV